MADAENNIWVDISFTAPYINVKDVNVDVQLADSENIGSYSMPVIYSAIEISEDEVDVSVQYFNETTATSGVKNVAEEYFAYTVPLQDDLVISLVEFTAGQSDLDQEIDTDVKYTTGFNSISGSLNEKVSFIAGNEYLGVDNIPNSYSNFATSSGVIDRLVNYTNFSGNYTSSGVLIPFNVDDSNYLSEYTAGNMGPLVGLDNTVDITFAGWVDFPVQADVYSADSNLIKGYTGEVTTITGTVTPNYIEVFSAELEILEHPIDVYCSLEDLSSLNQEVETRNGRIGYLEQDIYSTIDKRRNLTLDISLYSLKISNFSLDEGEFTSASGFISVDITDDECPISTSGTYFMLDDSIVPVTFSGIDDGYRMYYTPAESFGFIEGPVVFTAHAENECGDILEQDFYLTFGYIVEYKNHISTGMNYGFDTKVAVRVTAENYASCPRTNSLAWDFRSIHQRNRDLGASITGNFYVLDNEDLTAEIYPHSTAYFYGKEITVVVKAKDFSGNEMEDLVFSYTIEDKPE